MMNAKTMEITEEKSMNVGVVTTAHQGCPEWIRNGSEHLKVQCLSHSLPYLNVGDRIVYTMLPEGVMVLYQIIPVHQHQPTYHPLQMDEDTIKIQAGAASLTIQSDRSIQMKVNHHQMHLDQHGRFLCQANEIELKSNTDITLAAPGNQIHLTTKE